MSRNPEASDNRPRRPTEQPPAFVCDCPGECQGTCSGEEVLAVHDILPSLEEKMPNDIIGYTIGVIAKRRHDEKRALAAFSDKEVALIDPSLLHELWASCMVVGAENKGSVVIRFQDRVKRGGAA